MKISARIAIIVGVLTALGFVSCQKDYTNRYCDTPSKVECGFDSNMVNIRVHNNTGHPICNLKIEYRKDISKVYEYGTLDNDENTCYTKLDFSKAYPVIHFDLGTGHFQIEDSLLNEALIYNNMKITTAGFYTLYLQIPVLESERIYSVIYPDDI
jgi:hypothetical protein